MKIKGNSLKKSSSMNPLNSVILLKKTDGNVWSILFNKPSNWGFLTGIKLSQLNRTLEQHLTERGQNYVTGSQGHYWVISVQPHCILQVWPVAWLPTHGTSQCVSQGGMQVWGCPVHNILPILMTLLGIKSWRKSCKIFLLFM